MCYSKTNPNSFENITTKWIPEIQKYTKDVNILLVATKLDNMNDPEILKILTEKNIKPISNIDGMIVSKTNNCFSGFFETSAKKNINIDILNKWIIDFITKNESKNYENENNYCILQ